MKEHQQFQACLATELSSSILSSSLIPALPSCSFHPISLGKSHVTSIKSHTRQKKFLRFPPLERKLVPAREQHERVLETEEDTDD